MRVHKEKYKKAVEMLIQGKSYREIAKRLGLSISQISEIAKGLDLYVDLREERRKLRREIRKLKSQKEQLEKEIAEKREVLSGLEECFEKLGRVEELTRKIYDNILEGKTEPLKSKAERDFYQSKLIEELMGRIREFHRAYARLELEHYAEKLREVLGSNPRRRGQPTTPARL